MKEFRNYLIKHDKTAQLIGLAYFKSSLILLTIIGCWTITVYNKYNLLNDPSLVKNISIIGLMALFFQVMIITIEKDK